MKKPIQGEASPEGTGSAGAGEEKPDPDTQETTTVNIEELKKYIEEALKIPAIKEKLAKLASEESVQAIITSLANINSNESTDKALSESLNQIKAIQNSINDLSEKFNKLDNIKAELSDISSNSNKLATQDSVDKIRDKVDNLANLKNDLNNVKEQFKSWKLNLEDGVLGLISQANNEITRHFDNLDKNVESSIKKGLQNTLDNSAIAESVVIRVNKGINDLKSDSRDIKYQAEDIKDQAKDNVHFLSSAIPFALFIIVFGIFATAGFIVHIENSALLFAALWFIVITAGALTVFSLLRSAFSWGNSTIFIMCYYIAMGVLLAVLFGLSFAILIQCLSV